MKQIYESAIAQLEAEKNAKVTALKQTIMQEKILPHFQELEVACQKAKVELTDKYNKQVAEINLSFEKAKDELDTALAEKKRKYEESTINGEIATIEYSYNKEIVELRKKVDSIGD